MDIYREEILEHWQNPQNFGVLDNADLVIEQVNPLCGDEVTFFFKFFFPTSSSRKRGSKKRILDQVENGKMRIKDVSFTGRGCSISTASASILSEKIKGKTIETISKITGEDVFEMLGGPVAPARLKCAFLPLEAVRKIIK